MYLIRWSYRDGQAVQRYHRRRYARLGGHLRVLFVARAVRRALQAAGVREGIVLDFPCGTGVVATVLVRAGFRCVAGDLSPAMLRFARARGGPALGAVRADIEHPPFRSKAVAAVVCLRFFPHLPVDRWVPVLRELGAVTHGPLVLGLPMRRSSKHRWRALKRRLGLNGKERPIFGMQLLGTLLGEAGFRIRARIWQSPFTDTALVIAEGLEMSSPKITPLRPEGVHAHRAPSPPELRT